MLSLGPGPFPGLLDMWGGGGGLIEYRAAILASHGYAALALEYFAPGEMETANMEIKYFEVITVLHSKCKQYCKYSKYTFQH